LDSRISAHPRSVCDSQVCPGVVAMPQGIISYCVSCARQDPARPPFWAAVHPIEYDSLNNLGVLHEWVRQSIGRVISWNLRTGKGARTIISDDPSANSCRQVRIVEAFHSQLHYLFEPQKAKNRVGDGSRSRRVDDHSPCRDLLRRGAGHLKNWQMPQVPGEPRSRDSTCGQPGPRSAPHRRTAASAARRRLRLAPALRMDFG